MTAEWKPEIDDWGQASQTTWLGRDGANTLRVYRLRNSWAWQVTTPDNFTMSGIQVPTIGQALEAAEHASVRLTDAASAVEQA